MGLTNLVLRRPVSTALVILGIVVFGAFSIFSFDMELIPDINMPMMMVMTVYPGANPDSVEQLITNEIEDAGSALSGVDSVISYSYENYSMVAFSYDYDMDMNDAYTNLSAMLDTLKLPEDAKEPQIIEMDVNAMDTLTISAVNDGSPDMMSYIKDTVVPELESVTNVAQVSVTGGAEHYIRVKLNEQKMNQYGLTINTIAAQVGAANYNVPAGSISAGNQNISVSTSAEFETLQDLKNTTLTTGRGALITLGDVADISFSAKDADSISQYNGEDDITISIKKVQSASTVRVCDDVKNKIKALTATNPGVKFNYSYDSGGEIISSLKSVAETLLLGIVLAMIVLFLFFGEWKASVIVGVSMPLSLMTTMVLMNLFGFGLNIITMGALVIAIGMIVDSSIVVIESCFRLKEECDSIHEAALKGTGVVVMSIVASTITTIVVYLPMSMMKGLAGQMFSQLGMIIVFAMIASLISALSIVPLLFVMMDPKEKQDSMINRFLDWVKVGYDVTLRKLLYRRKTTLLATVLMLVVSVWLASTLGVELIPTTYDGSIKITSTFRSGTKVEEMKNAMADIEKLVVADKSFEFYTLSVSSNQAIVTATAVNGCKRTSQEAVEEYTKALSGITNMDVFVQAEGGGSSMMSTYSSDLVEVTIDADDLDQLAVGSECVENMMKEIPGVIHISSNATNAQTTAHIIVDPLKASNYGLTPAAVAGDLYYTLTGVTATTMKQDGEEYDIILNYPDGAYDDINKLMNKTMMSQTGKAIPLSEFARVEYGQQLQMIQKTDGKYQATVSATAAADYKNKVSSAVKKAMKTLTLPEGVKKSKSYMENMRGENLTAIFGAILSGIFLVFLVMAMQFESPRFSLMVMTCIPFSLIGSFLFLFLCRNSLNMVSLMGFLMLMGIVVNNGILLVDTANQEREHMEIEEALVTAGKIRLRPILMTTLTTILAMIPMAFFSNNKMMQGMAMVIMGGLVASTLLCLLLMPTFYLMIDKETRRTRREEKRARKMEKKQVSREKE